MEQNERDKITALLPDLVEHVDCNVLLLSHLISTKTIGNADYHHLIALSNKLDRSKALLDILCTRKDGYKFLVESLGKTSQTGALNILEEPIPLESTQHNIIDLPLTSTNESEICTFRKIPFQSKEATDLFTGRRSELKILLESLLSDGGTVSITGIGGIGKTELAKMCLHKLDEDTYKNVFKQIIWINCESSFTATTDFTTIAKDYLKVPILGSSRQHRDISSILNDVYEKLQKSKSLIVLDNLETEEMLHTYLRSTSENSKLSILVTSQCIEFGTHIPLDNLDLQEAVELVKKGLNVSTPISEEFETGILELVLRLQMLPLAISQAIGYIKQKRVTQINYHPRDYLVDIDRIPERVFDKKCFIDKSPNRKTIYKTLDLALSTIEASGSGDELVSKILSKVAFMAPDNISSSLFLELAENDVDAIEDALVLVRQFSIIKFSPVDKNSTVYFSIHRLVQDVLRIRIAQKNETESSINSTMKLVRFHLSYDLIDHALETWKHTSKLESLVKEFSEFPFSLSDEMVNCGRISDAFNFSTTSLVVLKESLCISDHASIIFWLQSYNNWLLYLQGKVDYSLEKLQATLIEAKTYLPDGDKVVFRIRYFIAHIFVESGQSDKSASICDEMHKDYKLHNNVTLRTLYDIGRLEFFLKRPENAQNTAKQILENLTLSSDKDKEKLEFDTKCLVAHILGSMGNYPECISLYSEVLQTDTKHDQKILTIFNRGLVYHNMGTFQCYSGHFEESYDSYQKALNEMKGHEENACARILQTKSNMVSNLLIRNMVDEALPFALEVYEQTKQIFGDNTYWTSRALGNVGVAYSKTGRHEDAVTILTQLIENEGYVSRCDDQARLEKFYLALSLEKMDRLERANELLNEIRPKSLEDPAFKLFTIEMVDSALERMHKTINKKMVLSKVYKFNKLYL